MGAQSNSTWGKVKPSQPAAIGMVLASTILIGAVPSFAKLAYQSGASVALVIAV